MTCSPFTMSLWVGALVALIATCLIGEPSEIFMLCLIALIGVCVLLVHEMIDFVYWRREIRRQQEEIEWHHNRVDREIHRNL